MVEVKSVNARIRKGIRARGHFPTEAAALKCVCIALMSLPHSGRLQAVDHALEGATQRIPIALGGRLAPKQPLIAQQPRSAVELTPVCRQA
ncbi:hypothetical protein ACF07Y_37285 [Streptomyces sp. NPDC016566]|uniref:hypothetical protein n=1 Tax=Streptomyces sp. NPDC016566 TaxID=3364967 RepID=UPI0036F8DA5C